MANYCYQQQEASSTGSKWHPQHLSGQPVNMQDWAHAFPRPRHTRVMKPRSAGNSPSSISRRRTTVAQSTAQGIPTQYQSSLEAALLASATRNSRPISWHPSPNRPRGLSNSYLPEFSSEMYPGIVGVPDQMNAFPVYANDNMVPYGMTNGPAYSPGYLPMYSDPMQEAIPMPQPTPALSMPGSQVEQTGWDFTTTNNEFSNIAQTTSDGWSLDMLSMANIPPAETTCPSYASVPSPGELSGPSTPDFLPVQQFEDVSTSTQSKKVAKPEEELVGMGLYNQPERTLAQTQAGSVGKGLKLEETFSPSDDEKEDSGEDVEDLQQDQQTIPDQSATMIQQHQPPQQQMSVHKQQSKSGLNLLHKSFFFDHDELDQQPMPVAQPFANLSQPCMSYGYGGWL